MSKIETYAESTCGPKIVRAPPSRTGNQRRLHKRLNYNSLHFFLSKFYLISINTTRDMVSKVAVLDDCYVLISFRVFWEIIAGETIQYHVAIITIETMSQENAKNVIRRNRYARKDMEY